MKRIAILIALAGLASVSARADWVLDNDGSRLSFISTKADTVAEVHRFDSLSGTIDDAGNVNVTIDLASVDTLIPLRDDRMREMLFETDRFPTATVMAKIDPNAVKMLHGGMSTTMTVNAKLSLHGQMLDLPMDVVVAKLGDSRMLVTTVQPVVVNASQVGLVDGIEALRNVAGLPSISPAVPVNVVLSFRSGT